MSALVTAAGSVIMTSWWCYGADLSPTGIRVATIAPGTILTPAYGKAGDRLEAYWGPQVPHSGVRRGVPTQANRRAIEHYSL
jgi:NAD(P)-dependent dehydrogenase (short-subunit alcohol dehydrogenase family)